MTRFSALLLSFALLAAPSGLAETVVWADWEKVRTMLTQGEFRSRIAIELKSPKRVTLTQNRGEFHPRNRKEVELKPSKWVQGKVIEATGEGLQVVFQRAEISFQHEDISRIRLVPRRKDRWTGLVLGIPAGIGAGFLAAVAASGFDIDRRGGAQTAAFVATLIAVPYVFHKFWGGGRQAVVVELEESTTQKPLVPSQGSATYPVESTVGRGGQS